jgi:hypothetical protein
MENNVKQSMEFTGKRALIGLVAYLLLAAIVTIVLMHG